MTIGTATTPARNSGAPTESGRRRARILVRLAVLVVVLGVITNMLVVAQRGADDESEVYDDETGSAAVVPGELPGVASRV